MSARNLIKAISPSLSAVSAATSKVVRSTVVRAQTTLSDGTQSTNQVQTKKPRHKKKKDKLADSGEPADADDEQAKELHHQQQPPGKKKLRKLRFQQQQLSPREFLMTSAESLHYTGSVVIHKPAATPIEQTPTESGAPTKILIRTSSSATLPIVDAAPPTDHTSIYIQPLLILDINGILCHRIRKSRDTYDPRATYRPTIGTVANTPIIGRPYLQTFLSFLQEHFTLAIWTSAKKKTATQLISRLVPLEISKRFLFVWAQHDCHLEGPDDGVVDETQRRDTLFEKHLSKVWQAFPLWNAHNTLLVDDSPEKCVAVKDNAIHPPPLNGRVMERHDSSALMSDDDNVAQQLEFMKKLAVHWSEHDLVQLWADDETDRDAVYTTTRTQADFLRDHVGDLKGK